VKFRNQLTFLFILSIILVTVFVVDKQAEAESSPWDLVISGLVDYPINFTYSELQRFPMVSEVALLQCVYDPEGQWAQLYNWTGIPLFFLLNVAGVKAEATEVVFYAPDGFSSSLTIERAMHPTTLLALQANGTILLPSNGYPYRLVVPCKWGYKWVKWIAEIEVVDYDYKGTYESMGFSDEADIPNCTFPPSTTPPFEVFDIVLGSKTHSIVTLSNSTINSFDFILREQICFNITGPANTTGYFYVTIPKELLRCDNPEEWQVWVNNNTLIDDRKVIVVTSYTYVHFTYNHSIQEVQITITFPNASERARHDIGVTDITTSKTVMAQGYNLNITVTILNYGNDTEPRNITVYANTTSIASQNVTLTSKNATTVTFAWNTTGWARGNYTISANATTVPGETYTTDNNKTDGWVMVTILGDINGDRVVDVVDLTIASLALWSKPGDPKWNSDADLNGDNLIDIVDLTLVTIHYWETW